MDGVVDLTFEALGDLDNHELGHHRPEFKDSDDPATKRHLYRLWHRAEGGISFDG